MINKEELKKDKFYIIDNGLGAPVKAQLLESPKWIVTGKLIFI